MPKILAWSQSVSSYIVPPSGIDSQFDPDLNDATYTEQMVVPTMTGPFQPATASL